MTNGKRIMNALGLVYKVEELDNTQESISVGIDNIEVCFPLAWWDSCCGEGETNETTKITLTRQEIEDLITALDDDIRYKKYESGCADEYEWQVSSYTKLMEKLIIAKEV